MAVVNRNQPIEFIVKPKQDLYLEGTLRKLPRVQKGEAYPCQMQKNQNFSCLFRHYAKHNGLRKEDLVFTFVDELLPDQTPETVHLMPHDEIWVEHRTEGAKEVEQELTSPTASAYSEQFRRLFESGEHADVIFEVGDSRTEIHAHKCVLTARSEYFHAMFLGGMAESMSTTNSNTSNSNSVVRSRSQCDPSTFRRLLEFIYSNNVLGIEDFPAQEIVSLLMLANEYLLDDLRSLCELHSTHIISMDNIAQLLLLSAGHNASLLKQACAKFVSEFNVQLATDLGFRREIERNPELGVLLFEASLPTLPSSAVAIAAAGGGGSPCGSDSGIMRSFRSNNSNCGSGSTIGVANKRRRLSNSAHNNNNSSSNSESEIDLLVPQLGSSTTAVPAAAAAANSNTNTGAVSTVHYYRQGMDQMHFLQQQQQQHAPLSTLSSTFLSNMISMQSIPMPPVPSTAAAERHYLDNATAANATAANALAGTTTAANATAGTTTSPSSSSSPSRANVLNY